MIDHHLESIALASHMDGPKKSIGLSVYSLDMNHIYIYIIIFIYPLWYHPIVLYINIAIYFVFLGVSDMNDMNHVPSVRPRGYARYLSSHGEDDPHLLVSTDWGYPNSWMVG